MRSRFTAFVCNDEALLLRSWHKTTRPKALDLDRERQWLRLQIIDRQAGGPFDNQGEVEFVAIYREADERHRLHERSHFVRENREWFYVDGTHLV